MTKTAQQLRKGDRIMVETLPAVLFGEVVGLGRGRTVKIRDDQGKVSLIDARTLDIIGFTVLADARASLSSNLFGN